MILRQFCSKVLQNQVQLASKRSIHSTFPVFKAKIEGLDDYQRFYHNPHTTKIAFFQRFKLQTCAFIGLGIPVSNFVGSSTGVSIFSSCFSIALVGTTILGYVCSRVIGSVYIHKEDPSKVRIATVGFLGRRKDTIFDIQDIKLLSETSENPNRPIWRIHFHNDKLSNLLISTKFGGIQDPETFRLVFGKIIVE